MYEDKPMESGGPLKTLYAREQDAKMRAAQTYAVNECSAGAASTRMTADMVLQQKIESLYAEIHGLKALRAALPREMGFEADAAFWKLLVR